jgi:hypothetical protein
VTSIIDWPVLVVLSHGWDTWGNIGAFLEGLGTVILALGVFFGGGWALIRYFRERRRFTFLRMAVDARSIYDRADLVLVAITVHLENKGNTRIDARQERGEDGYVYNVVPNTCLHAGTIKIRAVPQGKEPILFDWYSLPALRVISRLVPGDHLVVSESDLEQINYLDEFQDPETDYKEVDFWLEPHESYDLMITVWLRPGVYAAKAFSLGPMTKHNEEEYWSCQTVFTVGTQPQLLATVGGIT